MAAGQQPKYGTLVHRKLHVGCEALIDGEKVRPQYLGTVTDLRGTSTAEQLLKIGRDTNHASLNS